MIVNHLIRGFHVRADTSSYFRAVEFLISGEGEAQFSRLLHPLYIGLAAALNPVLSPEIVFMLINWLSEVGMGLIFYHALVRAGVEERVSLLSAAILLSSFVVMKDGLSLITDAFPWFVIVFTFYGTVLFEERKKLKILIAIGLLVGIGVLAKENAVVGLPFFPLWLYFRKRENLLKLSGYLVVIAMAAVIPVLINWFYAARVYDFGYLSWWLYNKETYVESMYTVGYLLQSLAISFGAAWAAVPFGVYALYRERKPRKPALLFIAAALPTALSFLAWPLFAARFLFVIFPITSLAAAYGLRYIEKRFIPHRLFTSCVVLLSFLINMVVLYYYDYLYSFFIGEELFWKI